MAKKKNSKSGRKARTQFAALPWRNAGNGRIEVLLITSRDTQRWIVPKGWPIKGLSPSAVAVREAFEEAGVEGVENKSALGIFEYQKRLSNGKLRRVAVELFSVHVDREHEKWPEMRERRKLWTEIPKAVDLVEEPGLKQLIGRFGETRP